MRNEETQRRQLFRHVFEVARIWRKTGFGEASDRLPAFSKHLIGAVLAKHHERTLNLANRLLERRQSGLARWITEEGVQCLFYGAEIGADFARDRFEQQALLRAARHGVQMRQFQHAKFFATTERTQPAYNSVSRMGEVGI